MVTSLRFRRFNCLFSVFIYLFIYFLFAILLFILSSNSSGLKKFFFNFSDLRETQWYFCFSNCLYLSVCHMLSKHLYVNTVHFVPNQFEFFWFFLWLVCVLNKLPLAIEAIVLCCCIISQMFVFGVFFT